MNEAQPDYSLDISIVRELSQDGTAHSTRSYKYRNLRTTPLTIDFPISFRVENEHAQTDDDFAHTTAGGDLLIAKSPDGEWIKFSAQPTIQAIRPVSWALGSSFGLSDLS